MNHGICRSSQSRSLIGDFLNAGVSFAMSNLESVLVLDFALDLRPPLLADAVLATAFKSSLAFDSFLRMIALLSSKAVQTPVCRSLIQRYRQKLPPSAIAPFLYAPASRRRRGN